MRDLDVVRLTFDTLPELVALDKVLYEAKFHPNPGDRVIAGSPYVADIARRVPRDFLGSVSSETTTFLRFIDPYGYTMFNRLQCIELSDEWAATVARFDSEDVRRWADDVASLIQRCADEYGYFVPFVGD